MTVFGKWKLLVLLLCLHLSATPSHAEGTKRPFTVTDSIETTRVLNSFRTGPVSISQTGKHFLVVLIWGDMKRNGSWVEFLTGETSSLEAARSAHVVARLFTKSTARDVALVGNVRWLGDEQVTFLWDDGVGVPQVAALNTQTGKLQKLTKSRTKIADYDISPAGGIIVYTAWAPQRGLESAAHSPRGFAVAGQSILSFVCSSSNRNEDRRYETFVQAGPAGVPRKVAEPDREWGDTPELLTLSPDGRYAVAVRPAGEIPESWDRYTEHIFKDTYLPGARRHPESPNEVRQYFLINTLHATARPMWDAPESPFGSVVWSPGGHSFVLGPTFLPVAEADAAALSGRAVVEVDAATGLVSRIPFTGDLPQYGYTPVSWDRSGVIELANTAEWVEKREPLRFRKIGGNWRSTDDKLQAVNAARNVEIRLRQGPSTPPALFAFDKRTGRELLIREIDPRLKSDFTFGRVELVHWKARDGKPWSGMLYYPVQYQAGQKYPFVIQTHGYSKDEFLPDGSPLTTVFAAQPLANRGIAVLQLGGPDGDLGADQATPREPQILVAGYEGAISTFAAAGLADREKVGIIGFSRTGWYVEYMLTHSPMRLAAAVAADNMDANYFQYVLSELDIGSEYDSDNGARPFGEGLKVWFQTAPGFNTDKIHTPLRLEEDSGPLCSSVLGHWEMFNNLRNLGKPVELFLIPDIEHGVHILQNPAQRLASQGGSVDWFRFWLKGEEDPDPGKAGQYLRWRKLRKMQELDEQHRPAEAPPQ